MAVSEMRKDEICKESRQSLSLRTQHAAKNIGNTVDSTKELSDSCLKQNKKERKRPELQIYRPGMGLQNRITNYKLGESVSPSSSEDKINYSDNDKNVLPSAVASCDNQSDRYSTDSLSLKIKELNVYEKSEPMKTQQKENATKSRKSTGKNRRPDIQVYIPKPKVAAKLTEREKSISERNSIELLDTKVISDTSKLKAKDIENFESTDEKSNTEVNKLKGVNAPSSSSRYSKSGRRKRRNSSGNRTKNDSVFSSHIKSRQSDSSLSRKANESELDGDSISDTYMSKNFLTNGVLPEQKYEISPNRNNIKCCTKQDNEKRRHHSRGHKQKHGCCDDPSLYLEKTTVNSLASTCDVDDWDSELLHVCDTKLTTKTFSQDDIHHVSDYRDIITDKKRSFSSQSSCDSAQIKNQGRQMENECGLFKSKSAVLDNVLTNSGDRRNSLVDVQKNKNNKISSSENFRSAQIPSQGSKNKITKSNDKKFAKSIPSSSDVDTQNYDSCGISQSDIKINANRLDEKSDKKFKRDKVEQILPPRFQKLNKSQNQHTSVEVKPKDFKGGGILRLPSESLASSEENKDQSIMNTKHVEEPQVFLHKHLYDPKNPDMPEIVNVATQSFSPFSLSTLFVDPNSNTEFGNSTGYSDLKHNFGYIPPPQPPGMKPSYRYQNLNFSTVGVSGTPRESVIPHMITGIAPPVPRVTTDSRFNTNSLTRVPMCYSEQLIPQDSGKKRMKPIVEKNMNDISQLERELSILMSKGLSQAEQKLLGQCRWKLQLRYENIILADPRYCAEKNVEQYLWKSVFYQLIEMLRKKIEEQPQDREELKQNLLNLVDEGTVFYENLLEKQQETYGFNLPELLDLDFLGPQCLPESIRLVLISSQKILIYLGDLARYKEQASGTTNYGKARSWYLKAQQIAPKNGRPYNQLAILALYARRKLDAVYYYMRSLAASNPFLSARESLLSLFEDAKKKYEQVERKRQEDRSIEREIGSGDAGEERCEIWIRPDGSSCHHPILLGEQRDLLEMKDMSTVELNKRFVTSFLHVHGKLFTKVGMETFIETVNQMLKEFHCLLRRTPSAMSSSRLLQLLAINMFAVATSSLKDQSLDHHCHSLLQEQALQVSLSMISLVMERSCSLLNDHLTSPEYPSQLVSDDLAQLLPAIKIWTDWMSCQRHLWAPPPPGADFQIGCKIDVWTSFAKLLTALRKIDTSIPEIIFERKEGYESVVLQEDSTLSGFVPLLGALHDPAYVQPPFDKDRARHCLRISRIQFFGDYLCGIPTPYLEFDVESKKFVSLVNVLCEEDTDGTLDVSWDNVNDEVDDALEEEDGFQLNCLETEEGNEIQKLWSRKEALSRAKAQQEKNKAQIQAVLQKYQHQRPTVLQIQPRYLIPDTNCFIDHLQQLKKLLDSTSYFLVVPLVVINELDGLARGSRENLHISPEHANKVTLFSREAITFLEQQFALRNPRLRSITSKGSILDTISFRSEDISDKKGTNDDLILSCCLHYSKDRAELYMPKNSDEPLQLFREAVLLTDDRNLRVKSLTHNVPVRDLLSFMHWANIR